MSITPFNGTQSGTFTNSAGSGTFTRTVTDQAGVRTAHSVFTLADGQTVTRDATFTKTASGWTRDVSTTLADGKTSTLQETGARQVDGSVAVTGTFQHGSQPTLDINGTDTNTGATSTSNLTFSNPWGATRTLDTTKTVAGTQITTTASGANFAGVTFSNTGALTILQSQSA